VVVLSLEMDQKSSGIKLVYVCVCEGGEGRFGNNPAPKSSFTPLTHTHVHQLNPAGLLVHLQRQYNPLVSLCVHRDALTIPLGSLCVHRNTPSDKPLIKIPPSTFPPHTWFYVLCYISHKRQHDSVCVLARCGVQSSRILVAF